jgi:hypothetical protein
MGGVLEKIAEYLTEMVNKVSGDIKEGAKSVGHINGINDDNEDIVPQKKLKLSTSFPFSSSDISSSLKLPLPLLPIPSISSPCLPTFVTQCKLPLTLLRDCMTDWPCMSGSTRWSCDRLDKLTGL